RSAPLIRRLPPHGVERLVVRLIGRFIGRFIRWWIGRLVERRHIIRLVIAGLLYAGDEIDLDDSGPDPLGHVDERARKVGGRGSGPLPYWSLRYFFRRRLRAGDRRIVRRLWRLLAGDRRVRRRLLAEGRRTARCE